MGNTSQSSIRIIYRMIFKHCKILTVEGSSGSSSGASLADVVAANLRPMSYIALPKPGRQRDFDQIALSIPDDTVFFIGKSLGAVRILNFLSSYRGQLWTLGKDRVYAMTIDAHSPWLYGRFWSYNQKNPYVEVHNTYQWESWPKGCRVEGHCKTNLQQWLQVDHFKILHTRESISLMREIWNSI